MTTTPDIPDALLDTLGCDSGDPLAAIDTNPYATTLEMAVELARNEARGILRAEFHNAGIDLN